MSKVPSNRGPGKREEGAAAWASDGDTPSAQLWLPIPVACWAATRVLRGGQCFSGLLCLNSSQDVPMGDGGATP